MQPVPFRRPDRSTFVASVVALPISECSIHHLYPLLVRTLSNALVVLEQDGEDVHLVTPEMAHIILRPAEVAERLNVLASARLVIDNVFEADLEPELHAGDVHTRAIRRAGQAVATLDLLPAPFPLDELLTPADLAWLKRVYNITGLSAGNFSERLDDTRFWMSASGVNKADLRVVGEDMMVVTGYDAERGAMRVSVPPTVKPRRVSFDAIEHWIIYRDHPAVGAILHVHAWLPGVRATSLHLPCGTVELGQAISDLIAAEPDPVRAVVGQRNHGLTITGTSLDEIIARVGGQLVRTVPFN